MGGKLSWSCGQGEIVQGWKKSRTTEGKAQEQSPLVEMKDPAA